MFFQRGFAVKVVTVSLACLWVAMVATPIGFSEERSALRFRDNGVASELGEVESVYAVAFSPNGEYLAAAGNQVDKANKSTIAIWKISKHNLVRQISTESTVQLQHVAWSPDGSVLAAGDMAGEVWIVGMEGKRINAFRHLEGRNTPIQRLMYLDNAHVFSVCRFSIGHIWNIWTNRTSTFQFWSAPGYVNGAAATPGAKVVAVCEVASITLFAARLSLPTGEIPLKVGHEIRKIEISQDGRCVVGVGKAGKLLLFDVTKKSLVKEWKAHDDEIYALATIPNGKGFVSADAAGHIKVWNQKGDVLAQMQKYDTPVAALAVSADGSLLASSGENQRIVIWDLKKLLTRKKQKGSG
jgi:WD40 repeat protein